MGRWGRGAGAVGWGGPGWGARGDGLSSLSVLEMAAGGISWNWQTKHLSAKWLFFFSTSTPVQVPVLCFACCPCCLPFVVDLDRGLCVCSLMTPTCNSAVPPPWHPINAILRYQTQSHSWLEESNCSAFLRVQRRWWRRQPLCVQLCSRLQGFVSTAWP